MSMYIAAFLSRAGIASRRKAIVLVQQGLVTVNGHVIQDPAYQIKKQDVISYQGKEVIIPDFVYLLLNKPTGCITTISDEKGRKTVFAYIQIKESVFPVGRLDQDTSGLLLFTNDGELAHQLMHPRFSVEKEYHATLDKVLDKKHFVNLKKGVTLSDGFIKPDSLLRTNSDGKQYSITLHSGKKRIIRRFFAHLGYTVIALDRVRYAFLKKGNLQQGQWRLLLENEVKSLKKLVEKTSNI